MMRRIFLLEPGNRWGVNIQVAVWDENMVRISIYDGLRVVRARVVNVRHAQKEFDRALALARKRLPTVVACIDSRGLEEYFDPADDVCDPKRCTEPDSMDKGLR